MQTKTITIPPTKPRRLRLTVDVAYLRTLAKGFAAGVAAGVIVMMLVMLGVG